MAAQVATMTKKNTPDAEPVPDQSAKIAGDVLRMARLAVAAGASNSVTRLLSDICRPALVKLLHELDKAGKLAPRD